MITLPDLSLMLRVGRFEIESEDVGTMHVKSTADSITITLTLNVKELENALIDCGPLDHEEVLDDRAALVRAAMCALPKVATWQREWLTRSLLFNTQIENLSPERFLRWAETRSRDIDLWLAVPAVRTHIRSINNKGPAVRRHRLAKILAGISYGRPLKIPSDVALYIKVRDAESLVRQCHQLLAESRNHKSTWELLRTQQPVVAAELERMGLHVLWFLSGDRPTAQARTPWFMACELVASGLGLKAATVRKSAGRIKAKRERDGRHPRSNPPRRPVKAQKN